MAQRMNSFPHGDKSEIYKSTNISYDKNLKSSFNVRKYSAYVLDASLYFKSFVVINTLCSSVKGVGSKLLTKLDKAFPDSIILGEAGCLLACDYDLFKAGLIDDPVDTLIKYYVSNGFININSKIGNYEESCIVAKFNGCYEKYARSNGSVLL